MDQKQQLEELFKKWKSKSNHDDTFIEDGIVNLSAWIKQKPRVLFFLKEAYTDEPTGYDLASALNNAGADFGRSQIWWRVAIWTQAVYDSIIPPQQYDERTIISKSDEIIRSISVINIKKSHGQKLSNNADLEKFLADDKAELTKELNIINPDVILCGNTFELLKSADFFPGICKGKCFSDDYIWNGKLIISYWHPSGRGIVSNDEVNYYAIREICRAAHYYFGITAW